MNLQEDLVHARNIIENGWEEISEFAFIYPFTNENIKASFRKEEIQNKDCLSVQASSDQVFDMYLYGAKSITTFDMNPLTEYYFYLKKAALLADLSLKEYFEFFSYHDLYSISANLFAFDEDIFARLLPFMPEEARLFWTYLDDEYTLFYVRKSRLFDYEHYDADFLSTTVNYLDIEHYENLKRKVKNLKISFIPTNIKLLPDRLNGSYDFMYFSNIIQYVKAMYGSKHKFYFSRKEAIRCLKQYEQLMKEVSNFLNPDGTMLIGYKFNSLTKKDKYARNLEKVFKKDEYFYRECPSVSNLEGNEKDTILVYKKRV